MCPNAFAFLLYEILLKISYIFSNKRVNASGRVDKKRGKIDTMRPFEPSSTVVHPCTTVEGEFCVRTKHRCCMEPLPSLAVLVEQPPIILRGYSLKCLMRLPYNDRLNFF